MRARGPSSRNVVHEADDVLTGRDRADRSGQHVVEQQRGHRELGQRTAHRLLDDAVHAAAHEHDGALEVDRPHAVRKEHHPEDEPRRGFADRFFRDAAGVERGRAEVAEDDGRRAPERDEGQEDRGRDDDLDAPVRAERGRAFTPCGRAVGIHLVRVYRYDRKKPLRKP